MRIKHLEKMIETEAVQKLRHLHSFLFCPVSREEDQFKIEQPIKSELFNILNSITELEWKNEANKKSKFEFSKNPPIVKLTKSVADLKKILVYNRANAWMILDDLIEDEILYLISNAVHSTSLIPDIWSFDISHSEMANMWIGIEYNPNYVSIKLVNTSNSTAKEIENITRSKKKAGIIHLEENLKGKYEVSEIEHALVTERLIEISIQIPII